MSHFSEPSIVSMTAHSGTNRAATVTIILLMVYHGIIVTRDDIINMLITFSLPASLDMIFLSDGISSWAMPGLRGTTSGDAWSQSNTDHICSSFRHILATQSGSSTFNTSTKSPTPAEEPTQSSIHDILKKQRQDVFTPPGDSIPWLSTHRIVSSDAGGRRYRPIIRASLSGSTTSSSPAVRLRSALRPAAIQR